MSFGSKQLDSAYDRWVTTPPEYDAVCDECGLRIDECECEVEE